MSVVLKAAGHFWFCLRYGWTVPPVVCYTVSCEFMLCASHIFIRRIFFFEQLFPVCAPVGRQGLAGLAAGATGAYGALPCRIGQPNVPLVSLWCNLALFGLVLVVLRLADVKFDLFHRHFSSAWLGMAVLYFYWAETTAFPVHLGLRKLF